MPVEPPELERAVVELADGSASPAVQLRPEVHAGGHGLVDISDRGGWRAHQAGRGQPGRTGEGTLPATNAS
jgi:hypothetical protein